jgi:hypothetical protein
MCKTRLKESDGNRPIGAMLVSGHGPQASGCHPLSLAPLRASLMYLGRGSALKHCIPNFCTVHLDAHASNSSFCRSLCLHTFRYKLSLTSMLYIYCCSQYFSPYNWFFFIANLCRRVAKFPNPEASGVPGSGRNWALGAAAYIACWATWILVVCIVYEFVYSFYRRWRVSKCHFPCSLHWNFY